VVDAKTVWKHIFHHPKSQRRPSGLVAGRRRRAALLFWLAVRPGCFMHVCAAVAGNGAQGGRLAQLQPLLEANGEYDKLLGGAFENYLLVRGQLAYDPHFFKVGTMPFASAAWLGTAGIVMRHLRLTFRSRTCRGFCSFGMGGVGFRPRQCMIGWMYTSRCRQVISAPGPRRQRWQGCWEG
jgi:hypothetical protein